MTNKNESVKLYCEAIDLIEKQQVLMSYGFSEHEAIQIVLKEEIKEMKELSK